MIECPICKEDKILNSFTDPEVLTKHLMEHHNKVLIAEELAYYLLGRR
jgi:hypothetical protein